MTDTTTTRPAHVPAPAEAPTEALSRLHSEAESRKPGALTAYYALEAEILDAYPPVDAPASTDPRDAEIEALKAEVARLSGVVNRVIDACGNTRPLVNMMDAKTLIQACNIGCDVGYNQALREVMRVITESSTPVES